MTSTAHLKTMATVVLAVLAAALVSVLVAYTPASAQTVGDAKPPRVIEVRPANGATGVSPTSGEFSEGRKVVAFFSEDMRPGSAMSAIKLYKKGSGNLEDATMGYNAAKRKVTLWPPNPLKRGVTYKAVVSTQAKDLAGNRLDQNQNRAGLQPKVWYFTIETAHHRAVEKRGGGKGRCGVRAEARENGAQACVGGVKAIGRR